MSDEKFFDYFMPNQVVFHVEHDATFQSQQVFAYLEQDPLITGDSLLKNLKFDVERPRTFTTEGSKSYSMPLGRIMGVPEAKDYDGKVKQSAELIDRLYSLWEKLLEGAGTQEGFQLKAAMPNWMCGGAQGQVITGGPGAKPTKPKERIDDARWGVRQVTTPGAPWGITSAKLSDEVAESATTSTEGGEVTVFILDTALPTTALEEAYLKYGTDQPLLHSLLASSGTIPADCFNIQYMPPDLMRSLVEDLNKPRKLYSYADKHNYYMADHGTFVAGIIHTIAPHARLELIQVLNDYGVGNFDTLTWGLEQIHAKRKQMSSGCLIVNCSLTLETPVRPDQLDGFVWKRNERKNINEFLTYLYSPIEKLFTDLDQVGAKIVAAAGNDGIGNVQRPAARYPAASDKVLGVGAMEDNKAIAKYSDRSDNPEVVGIYTFGGKASANLDADATGGMLGLYIGPFPGDPRPEKPGHVDLNDTGWARWAGTSFAAPVVAGWIAALCKHWKTPAAALNRIVKKLEKNPGTDERLLPVDQA
jgi:hypothetical protein